MNENYKKLNQDAYSQHTENFQKLDSVSSYLIYRDVPHLISQYFSKRIFQKSIQVLDIGCSIGTSIAYFSEALKICGYSADVTGIDINEEALHVARKRFPQFRFIKISETDSLGHLGKFDLIICYFVLVEMKSDEMIILLNKARQVLTQKGIMFVASPTVDIYHPKNHWYAINNQFQNNFPQKSILSGKEEFLDDQKVTLQVIDPKTGIEIVTFYDFLHTETAYRRSYQQAGLKLIGQHLPRGLSTETIPWCCEIEKPRLRIDILSLKGS